MGFLRLPSTLKNMLVWWTGYDKLFRGVNKYMYYTLPPHTPQPKLQIHCDSDTEITVDEWMKNSAT